MLCAPFDSDRTPDSTTMAASGQSKRRRNTTLPRVNPRQIISSVDTAVEEKCLYASCVLGCWLTVDEAGLAGTALPPPAAAAFLDFLWWLRHIRSLTPRARKPRNVTTRQTADHRPRNVVVQWRGWNAVRTDAVKLLRSQHHHLPKTLATLLLR